MVKLIGIADTMFARYDMGRLAETTIRKNGEGFKPVRYTVPGIKDLPVACKKLIEEFGCELVLALGMPGSKPIDKQCAHEASIGLMHAQLLTNRHIVEVFVHEDESNTEKDLAKIFEGRVKNHSLNAIALLKGKDSLRKLAGKGKRQGSEDAGVLREE